ncbi:MAG: hypothetical protein U0992_17160 [Planctomycetaceae bacterium]
MRAAILSSLAGPAVHVFEQLLKDREYANSDAGRTLLRQLAEMVERRHREDDIRTVLAAIAGTAAGRSSARTAAWQQAKGWDSRDTC